MHDNGARPPFAGDILIDADPLPGLLLRRYDTEIKSWRYYNCDLPGAMHGQQPQSLNVCKEIWDRDNVIYEVDPVKTAAPGEYRDAGAKTAGGQSYRAHGVWSMYPEAPVCDGGVWRV